MQPEERGWAYSQALLGVLEQYKVRLIWQPHESRFAVALFYAVTCDKGCATGIKLPGPAL